MMEVVRDLVRVMAIFAVLTACGEISVNGLRAGEMRVTNPMTQSPPEPAKPDIPVRVFRGQITDQVTIEKNERVLFVPITGGDGVTSWPEFKAAVTVMPGATLDGSATFSAGLAMKGERGHRATWHLDHDAPSRVVNPEIEWASVSGGPLFLSVEVGHLALIRHSALSELSLDASATADGKIEMTWSNIENSALTLHFPESTQAGTDDSLGPVLLSFNCNIFDSSFFNYPEAVINLRAQAIEANNFNQPPAAGKYVQGTGAAANVLRTFANGNFFVTRDRLGLSLEQALDRSSNGNFSLTEHNLQVDWIAKPFVVGIDGDMAPTETTQRKGALPIEFLGTTFFDSNQYLYLTMADASNYSTSNYLLSSTVRNAIQGRLNRYSFFSKTEVSTSVGIEVKIAELQGCVQSESTSTWYNSFICSPPFAIKYVATLKINGIAADAFTLVQPYSALTGGHVGRQTELAMIATLNHFLDDGKIDDIVPETAYF